MTVKVAEETWASVSHESTARKTGIGSLLSVAWAHFMSLPESRREKLTREA